MSAVIDCPTKLVAQPPDRTKPALDCLRIHIGSDARAGSDAPWTGKDPPGLFLYFGAGRRVHLVAPEGFKRGGALLWDFKPIEAWLWQFASMDRWDEPALVPASTDGIQIENVELVHSGVTILDWTCRLWLDGSRGEANSRIVLTAPILAYKLARVKPALTWVPQLHWALRELGKTDSALYGASAGRKWCSEFASWALRKALWDTPTGDIDSEDMAAFFDKQHRKFLLADVKAGKYDLHPGDYLQFQKGDDKHSALFIHRDGDTLHTIDGNVRINDGAVTIADGPSATVKLFQHPVSELLSVGSCR
jgi:hypothetical protein